MKENNQDIKTTLRSNPLPVSTLHDRVYFENKNNTTKHIARLGFDVKLTLL